MPAQASMIAFRSVVHTFCESIISGERTSWRLVERNGLLCFKFDPPIPRREMARMMRLVGLHPAPNGPNIRHTSLLTDTSKMGCYSWSLSAGPPGLLGTCPGSTVGFMFRDGSSSVQVPTGSTGGTTAAARTVMIRRLSDVGVRMPRANQVFSKFICNDCYALKNKYAAPYVTFAQTWRTAWTKHALADGTFVQSMVSAIRLAVRKSAKLRASASTDSGLVATNDPRFFRIHDSGDFFSPQYTAAWFDIARHFPEVQFWAPTRVWTDPKQLQSLILSVGPIPDNMVIRPSSLWFGMDPPVVEGLGPGSTSGEFSVRRIAPDQLEIRYPTRNASDVWVCPAYLPSSMGGGAGPLVRNPALRLPVIQPGQIVGVPPPDKDFVFYPALVDPKTGQFVLDKHGRPKRATKAEIRAGLPTANAQAFAPSGSCEVALGPNGSRPCRVCWCTEGLDGCMPVAYSKH